MPGVGSVPLLSCLEKKGRRRAGSGGHSAPLPRLLAPRRGEEEGSSPPSSRAHRLPVRFVGDLQTAAPAHREKET